MVDLTHIEEQQFRQTIPAESVVLLSQKITAFLQLYQFIAAGEVGTGEQTGKMVQLQMMDPQRTMLFVNSKLLRQAFTDEIQRLGNELEANNIDMAAMLEQAEKNFNSIYKQ